MNLSASRQRLEVHALALEIGLAGRAGKRLQRSKTVVGDGIKHVHAAFAAARDACAAERAELVPFDLMQRLEDAETHRLCEELASARRPIPTPWAIDHGAAFPSQPMRSTASFLLSPSQLQTRLAVLPLSNVWTEAIALAWFTPAGPVYAAITHFCAIGMLVAKMPWNRGSASARHLVSTNAA